MDPIQELRNSHDNLSEALEAEDIGNDEVRDAAIEMCDALNAFWAAEPRGAVEIKHFVATANNAWGVGESIAEASRNMQDNLPTKIEGAATVFGSDQPLKVEADVYLRVYAKEGAVLVKFEV